MPEGNKTTKENYELFMSECRRWQTTLGLKGWDVGFTHEEISRDSRAEIIIDSVGRTATVSLGTEWTTDVITDKLLRLTAFHEMMELLLGKLGMYACNYISLTLVEEELHKIIRTMEHVLFPKYDKPAKSCDNCTCEQLLALYGFVQEN